jgi:hypothetical protein
MSASIDPQEGIPEFSSEWVPSDQGSPPRESFFGTDFNAVLSDWLRDARPPGRHKVKRRTAH